MTPGLPALRARYANQYSYANNHSVRSLATYAGWRLIVIILGSEAGCSCRAAAIVDNGDK
jgi:hypothetical protein